MTTEKIAVTVPRELIRKARRAVQKGAARSLSAYVSRAIEVQTMQDDLDDLLREMLEESGGPLTPEEIRRADAMLDAPGRRSKRR